MTYTSFTEALKSLPLGGFKLIGNGSPWRWGDYTVVYFVPANGIHPPMLYTFTSVHGCNWCHRTIRAIRCD